MAVGSVQQSGFTQKVPNSSAGLVSTEITIEKGTVLRITVDASSRGLLVCKKVLVVIMAIFLFLLLTFSFTGIFSCGLGAKTIMLGLAAISGGLVIISMVTFAILESITVRKNSLPMEKAASLGILPGINLQVTQDHSEVEKEISDTSLA